MKKYHLILITLFLSFNLLAQDRSPISKKVKETKSQLNKEFDLIENILIPNKNISISDKRLNDIESATYFDYDKNISKQLLSKSKDAIAMQIPYEHDEGSYLTLDLIKVPDSFYDFKVTTSSGNKLSGRDIGGVHYRGIVRNKELSSLVALSIFENEMMGIISITGKGTINIGKLTKKGQHIIYNDADLKPLETQNLCTTSGDRNPILESLYSNIQNKVSNNSVDNCLRIYFEVNHATYNHLGSSMSNTVNFVMGIFNQVAVIYMNESIALNMSEIYIWDTQDTYIDFLGSLPNQFALARPTFDGDIAHLLYFIQSDPDPIMNAGGYAVGVGGVCTPLPVPNITLSPHSITKLFPDFEIFPVFSRQVKVITHEIGHNLGSEHTHACVWNGDGTAIDGCEITEAQSPNPRCEQPSLPPSGSGTIMSYCDRIANVGIDFTLGFGPQPGNVIRNFVSSLNCLETCADCPYILNVTDTYSNGDNEYLEAVNGIYSIATVNSGADITHDAGKYIRLDPGFIADNGSNFLAKIDGCDDDPEGLVDGETSQGKSEESTDTEQIVMKNYPNPFTGHTTIEFTLQSDSPVTVFVSDVTGRQVATLLNNEQQTEGTHQVTFNGSAYPSGMYYYTIQAGQYIGTQKMTLIK